MLNINIIKRTFVRQAAEDDCGIACLKMIFKYAGIPEKEGLFSFKSVSENGLSLLELRDIARKSGITARVVQMEIGYLKTVKTPCILHVKNHLGEDHFEVFYGAVQSKGFVKYLIADPAIQVHFVSHADLVSRWKTHAALYFDGLENDLTAFRKPAWTYLLELRSYPLALWLVIPVISLFIAFLGVFLTWVLQKGMNDSLIFQTDVIFKIIFLLFLISLGKAAFIYIRQVILIKINLSVNRMLTLNLMENALNAGHAIAGKFTGVIKNGFSDVQRIQNAISLFIAVVLSDGTISLVLIGGIVWLSPLVFLLVFFYLLTMGIINFYNLSAVLYDQGKIREVTAAQEKHLNISFNLSLTLNQTDKAGQNSILREEHSKSLNLIKDLAMKMSGINFLNECVSGVMLMLVLLTGAEKIKNQAIDYPSFMLLIIECYLISTLIPKISMAFQQIADGADAALQLK